MDRRAFCRVLVTAPLIPVAAAQPMRPFRVAWVSPDRKNSPSPYLEAFRGGMRDLGYIEGRDIVIDAWWGEGSGEHVEQLVSDIVRSQPKVIVAGTGTVSVFVRAGVETPIVFTYSGDPVDGKIVESFARPGGNVTGISLFALDLLGKRLELLKELMPGARRVAIIANPQHPGEFKELDAAQAAAAKLGVTPHYLPDAAMPSWKRRSRPFSAPATMQFLPSPMASRWASPTASRPSRSRIASLQLTAGHISPAKAIS